MGDHSLMNPSYVLQEIHDMELLTEKDAEFSAEISADLDRLREHFADQYNDETNDKIVLDREQVADVLRFLGKIDVNRYRYTHHRPFIIRVYKTLMKDRRWIVGSRLRFLKK